MATKRYSTRRKKLNQPQPPWWLWAVIATAMVLVVGGLSALLIGNDATPAGGTPRLVVDQTQVDEGYQTYNTPVHTAFKIRNEGDGPLRILGEPQVQLVEGC